jgi:biofilm PGA synthesis N-glycosyltransferase PgaC
MFVQNFPDLHVVIFAVLGLALVVQLYFCVRYFFSLSLYKPDTVSSEKPPVTVLICAKNERENLEKHLPEILSQNYPEFEVVVVNDGSWDKTTAYLDDMVNWNPNLKHVKIDIDQTHRAGKKYALTLGIKSASHDFILLIDADCTPNSENWISEMMAQFDEKTDLVLGFSPYRRYMGLLNMFIRYETLYVGTQYLSFALNKRPYMGVGRNMAYRKSVFFQNKGFAKHIHLIAGDDDLLVQDLATKENTRICISKDAHTISEPHRNVSDWWNQKKRHLHIGKHYRNKFKFTLGIFNSSHLVEYMAIVVALLAGIDPLLVLIVWGVKTLINWIVLLLAFRKLGNVWISLAYPLIDIFYFLYYIVIGPITLFNRKVKW